MRFVNLTPHEIVVYRKEDCIINENGNNISNASFPVLVIKPSGIVARAEQIEEKLPNVECFGSSIPVVRTKYGNPVNLPEKENSVGYIVSAITANAAHEHGRDTNDLYIPNGIVRGNSGEIIGCLGFSQI